MLNLATINKILSFNFPRHIVSLKNRATIYSKTRCFEGVYFHEMSSFLRC